jgi:hypothetical protein
LPPPPPAIQTTRCGRHISLPARFNTWETIIAGGMDLPR